MYRFILWVRDSENQLWVKPAIGSLLAILFALLAALGNQFEVPESIPKIDRETLDGLLTVIASSMLAVTTFSLSIMVSAFATAATAASPRASALVVGDQDAHTAIASFLSAFIYSIIAKSALGVSYYGDAGRLLLFGSTIAVIGYLIYTLVRWVKTMSSLGRMGNTIDKIEAATAAAMQVYRDQPAMGAGLLPPDRAPGFPVTCDQVAYVRHIDVDALQRLAVDLDARIHIRVRPGTLVSPGTTLATVEVAESFDRQRALDAFVLGHARSFDQDPRFGLIVLSEVAQRALSPAVNDPGTAIAVLNALTRVLVEVRPDPDAPRIDQRDRLSLVELDEDDFVRQGFDPIARDGAASCEVIVRMQKLLATVADHAVLSLKAPAHRQAAVAARRAEQALVLDDEKRLVAELFATLHGAAIDTLDSPGTVR